MHQAQRRYAIFPLHISGSLAYLPIQRSERRRTYRTPVRRLNGKGSIMANRFVTTYRAWRKYRQTYNELMQLSNRDLADVGIQRSEIPEIARQAAAEI